MKITEANAAPEIKLSPLQKFSERKFNLELSGFDLIALYAVSQRISGTTKAREVFSDCVGKEDNSFCTNIGEIEGAGEALTEFEAINSITNTIRFAR